MTPAPGEPGSGQSPDDGADGSDAAAQGSSKDVPARDSSESEPEQESFGEAAPQPEQLDSKAEVPEESEDRPAEPEGEPALTDVPADAYLEDEKDWLKWPFSKANQRDPQQVEPHRWASAGAFIGWVSHNSASDAIKYRPGMAWGGYLRPEFFSWLGLRLFYREERIPVQVERGAYDYGDDTYDDDFEQPNIELLNLGARLEPTLVLHPRFRVRGIAGWSWSWFRAPFPKSDDFELEKTFRSAVQMDVSFGAGLSLDIVENWIDISLDSAYSIPAGQTGSAYEPAQIVRDGGIHHIAPMPKLQNSLDFLISLGVIL
jgi:hypothetical protein